MRKIFLAVAAMAMLATACTKDDAVSGGTESLVSFTIDSPELMTRADGDGEHITHLQYAFYNEDGILAEISKIGDDAIEFTGKTTIQVYLVEGRTYSAIFWADNAAAPYDVTFDEDNVSESTMTISNTTWTANSDIYDAFYKFEGNIRPEEKTHRVELTRPFAQINIATADTEAARKAGVEVATSEVAVVKGYTTLSLVDGEVSDKADFTFSAAALPNDPATVTVGGKTYNMLAMNYVLVNSRELLQKVALTMVDDDNKTLTREYTTVPVQRNYKTYIVGNLLTTQNDFTVETKPGFDDTTLPETAIEKLIMDIQTVGGEFTLPGDITLKGTLELRHDVVLDLNGYTITADLKQEGRHHYAIDNYAALTLKGEGNIEARGIENFGTMTIDGNITITNVDTNGGAAIWNEGNIVINGGTFTTNANAGDGSYGAALNTRENGTAVVNGGNFIAYSQLTYAIINAGETVINNATVKGKHGAVAGEGSKATVINGGSFELMENPNVSDHCAYEVSEIKGGTFTLGVNTDCGAQVFYKSQIAEGFAAYDNGDETYTVLPALTAALKDVTTATEVEVTTDMHVATGTTPHTHNATAPITINGNGQSVISTAESADDFQWDGGNIPAMSTVLSSKDGSKVTVNDLTFEGTMSALMLGHYVDSKSNWYNTELNNVNVVNTEVVSFSQNIAPAVCVYGTAVLNNCNIYGTTLSELDTDPMWPVYDVAAVNYSTTTVNGGKIGSFYVWNQAGVVLDNGAEVETLVIRGNMNTTNYGVTIKAGTKVGAIDLSAITTKTKVNITIEAGATVGKIVANGVEYASVEAFQNTVPVANQAALADALKNGSTTVVVAAGEYTFPASSIKEGVTIKCEEGTVFTGNSKLNINGATVEGATFSNPSGNAVDQTINGTFKNCTFTGSNGVRSAYAGETVVFEDCVFDGSVYGVHFDGGTNDVVFRNCTISGFNALGAALTMATFEGCTFVGNGKSGYNGANLWGSAKLIDCEFTFDGTTANEWIDCIGADKTYEFTNCTVNGVDFTADNYTSFEQIFSRNNATVKINGVDCAM